MVEQTSPIQIKISKHEGSYISAGTSSHNFRKAQAQADEQNDCAMPVARNDLEIVDQPIIHTAMKIFCEQREGKFYRI